MTDRCPCEDGHPERCPDVGAGAEPLDPAVAAILNDLELYAIPGENHIIDTINPVTGLTRYYERDEAAVVAKYPGAKRYTWIEWQTNASARQRSPITWHPTDHDTYRRMLECLPPELWTGGAFLVGEPSDHDIWSGAPRFAAYWHRNGVYLYASRPLTRAELRAELNQKGRTA